MERKRRIEIEAKKNPDLLWGAEEIARHTGRTRKQIYWLVSRGVLRGAVQKLTPKVMIGSRSAIDEALKRLWEGKKNG